MRSVDLLRRQHRDVSEQLTRARGSSDNGERVRLLGDIAEALTIHATLEEQHLHPLVREAGLVDVADRSERDHAQVKQLVARLLGMKRRDPDLERVLGELEDAVREHVTLEEEQVFPAIEGKLDAERLESVGEQMQRAEGDLRQKELLQMAEEQPGA